MADLAGFDANNVEPATDFDLLPPNKYEVVITKRSLNRTARRLEVIWS